MTPFSRSCLQSVSSFLLTAAILTVAQLPFEPVAFGQEGKGASSDAWFIKSAKDRNEKTSDGNQGW